MIIKKLVVGPYMSNCYIVGSEATKDGMIIDPGDDARKILDKVAEEALDIKLIVATHGHIDHISALKEVKEVTGVQAAIHDTEARLFRGHSAGDLFNRLLKDGDRIDIDELHFRVIHTPGHTPGGICLLGHGVVFSGDTLFNYGIGRYDLSGGDYTQLMDSLQNKLMTLPDDIIVYPGHGPDTTIGTERRANPFLRG